jgi:iron complex outermembrane receptor protein
VGRVLVAGHTLVAVRGSAMEQRHNHRFGPVAETDRHRTGFLETTASRATVRGTYVVGAAIQREDYRARDVPETSYRFTIPSAFAQADVTPVGWLSLAASARVDVHSAYGTSVNPLVSALVRAPGAVTVRLALGTGTQAPTPFTETTEVTGLTPLQRFDPDALRAERATSASADIGRRFGALEVNATAFGSEVRHPLQLVAVEDGAGAPQLELVNAPAPIRTRGGELLARWTAEPLHVTASYSYLRSTEWSPDGTGRRDVPLTPRHSAGVVAAYEREGQTRVGLELYYTGRQTLDDNPFRSESRPYVVVGMLAEQRFGRWRVFVNGENLGDVRQTRYDPLVRPTRGLGGRWTTDAWTLLEGRVVNGGIRVEL